MNLSDNVVHLLTGADMGRQYHRTEKVVLTEISALTSHVLMVVSVLTKTHYRIIVVSVLPHTGETTASIQIKTRR